MTDPNRAESESRTVDALLSDFFRSERPSAWPAAFAAPPVETATVPSALAETRHPNGWLTRGRATLAASAAFLLVAGLAVTPDAAPRSAAPTSARGPSLLGGSSAEVPAAKVRGAAKSPETAPAVSPPR